MYGYSMKARLYKYMYITIAAASMCLGCLAALKIRTTALKKERNITRVGTLGAYFRIVMAYPTGVKKSAKFGFKIGI